MATKSTRRRHESSPFGGRPCQELRDRSGSLSRAVPSADSAQGLALRGAGFDVQVYERVAGPMETRGAGIVVQGELIDLLRTHGAGALPTTHCRVRRYLSPEGGEGEVQRAPQDFTSWEAIYRTLAAAFPADRYHRGATLTDFGNGERAVQAHIDGHGVVEADVLVAADGAQSPTRRRFLPDLTSTYAGYVAWRGTLDEADAPPDLVRFFDDAFTFSEARSAGHILVYFIPGDGADTTSGKRRLNWVWYVGVGEADLRPYPCRSRRAPAPRLASVRRYAGLGHP